MKSSPLTVYNAILDANVLANRVERIILFSLAEFGFFTPIWSPDIINEVETSALPNIIVDKPDIAFISKQIVQGITSRFPLSMITAYNDVKPNFNLRDPDDMHVVKLALYVSANVIVTRDKDFSNAILNPQGLNAMTPDKFVVKIASRDLKQAFRAIENANRFLFRKKPYDIDGFIGVLKNKYDLNEIADLLEQYKDFW